MEKVSKFSTVTATGFFIFSFIVMFVVWGLKNAYPH